MEGRNKEEGRSVIIKGFEEGLCGGYGEVWCLK
jgi:hypothetical protein